jgi:hypothetical protein
VVTTTADLDKLVEYSHATGRIVVKHGPFKEISNSKLKRIDGELKIRGYDLLESVSFPSLEEAGDIEISNQYNFSSSDPLKKVDLGNLKKVKNITIRSFSIVSLDLSSLEYIDGIAWIDCPNLKRLDLDALVFASQLGVMLTPDGEVGVDSLKYLWGGGLSPYPHDSVVGPKFKASEDKLKTLIEQNKARSDSENKKIKEQFLQ